MATTDRRSLRTRLAWGATIAPQSMTDDIEGSGVDTKFARRALILISLGTGARATISVLESSDDDTYTAISGASKTFTSAGLHVMEVADHKRYLRADAAHSGTGTIAVALIAADLLTSPRNAA